MERRNFPGPLIGDEIFTRDAEGVWQHPGLTSDHLSRTVGPIRLARMPLRLRDSFVQVDDTFDSGTDFDFDSIPEPVRVRSVVTNAAIESVSTPAGVFPEALRQRTAMTQTVTLTSNQQRVTVNLTIDEWRVRDLGLVRRHVVVASGNIRETDGIALTAYGVGSLRSEYVAPTIVSRMPTSQGPFHPWSAIISASFSEPIDELSIGPDTFILTGPDGQRVQGNYELVGDTLSFLPAGGYQADGNYVARVTTDVQDLVGNPMAQDHVWQFQVDSSISLSTSVASAGLPAAEVPTPANPLQAEIHGFAPGWASVTARALGR
jgi:hypothetical protein